MDKLKQLLKPPIFVDDPEKTRMAAILNVIVLVSLGIWLLVLGLLPFSSQIWNGGLAIGSLIVFGFGALFFLHSGYVYGVAQSFVFFIWVASTAFIVLSGGINNPETGAYLLVIACAGLLSGIRAMWTFTILSIAATGVIYGLEMFNWLPAPLLETDLLGGLVIGVTNPLLVSSVFYMALANLRQVMHDSQKTAQVLAEQNRELEDIRTSLEAQVTARTQVAEIARLEAETAHTALQEQMWQVVGLAKLAELSAQISNASDMINATLNYICQYVDATIGAFYLWKDERFVLTTHYAYPPDQCERSFALGEGLIGQVAVEKRVHILEAGDIPFKLVSSFGDIALAQISMFPLLYMETLIGVVEIGRLTPLSVSHKQFLEQACERVAANIHVIQAQHKIALLLQETQQKTEELQVQEEELQATNEELLAQTEALRMEQARSEREHERSCDDDD